MPKSVPVKRDLFHSIQDGLLEPICRGLVGYVSYLAPCGASTIMSEYVLYEPILRIVLAKRYSASCEHEVSKGALGDAKRIDFLVQGQGRRIGIEVKRIKNKPTSIVKDCIKLTSLIEKKQIDVGYVVLFGTKTLLNKTIRKANKDRGYSMPTKPSLVHWASGHTSYAATWIRVAEKKRLN